MQKPTYSETVRAYLELIVETQGNKLWAEIMRHTEDETLARKLWLHFFVTALKSIKPERLKNYGEAWLINLLSTVLAQYEHVGAEIFKEAFQWPDTHEFGANERGEECEQSGSKEDLCVPLELMARTSQVLKATAAYLDAEKQHKGPKWTFIATLITIVFACIAIGYGALAHYGYTLEKLWQLVIYHSR